MTSQAFDQGSMMAHAHRYMMRVVNAQRKLDGAAAEVERIRSNVGAIGAIDYSKPSTQSSTTPDGVHNAAMRLNAAIERVVSSAEEYAAEVERFNELLPLIDDGDSIRILVQHYMCGLTWSEVADIIGYSYDHTKSAKREKALLDLYDAMCEHEHHPQSPDTMR